MTAPEPRTEDLTRKAVSPWVKAFVLLHVVAIVTWALPRPKQAILEGTAKPVGSDHLLVLANEIRVWKPLNAYTQATGSWQYWDMFAPDPSSIDVWADAEVELKDGSKVTVDYPRIYRLGIGEKYLKERYRKFFERAGNTDHAFLWTPFAIQLARRAAKSPENPPVAVVLRKHTLPIAGPGQTQATEYSTETYWRYIVRPQDLKGPIR